jgi:hypothetical protein
VLVDLPVPTWESWQAQYRKDIITMAWWDELQRPKPKIERVYNPRPLYYPIWKDKTEWRNAKNRPNLVPRNFKGHCLVLAPAVRVPDRGYMLLDHCHRIRELRPTLLAVDALIVRPEQLCAFADLIVNWYE